MTTAIVLEEVGPWVETPIPDNSIFTHAVSYRICDFCDESAIQDIWAGKDESEWRAFYRLEPDGLNVCEHCLSEVVAPDTS